MLDFLIPVELRGEPMQLSDVLITDLLAIRRPSAAGQPDAVPTIPVPLMGSDLPVRALLTARCRQAMALCGAHSAGISMFSPSGFDTLTWLGVVGELAPLDQHVFPRDDSACGICFSYRAPQLFRLPHLYFSWIKKAGVLMQELLVVPIQGPYGAFFGTMWVVSHRAGAPQFTASEVLVLERLSAGLWSRLSDLGSSASAP